MDSTFMSNCANHPKEVAGISDMKVLAEMIGDLHYETLEEFLLCLARKIDDDADVDFEAGRKNLGGVLYEAAVLIFDARKAIGKAWEISKPFMTDKPPTNGR